MFKVMLFARRRQGLSFDQFRKDFEDKFVPLVSSLMTGGTVPALVDYRRNYFLYDDPANINADGLQFDILLENWFVDRAAFAANRVAHAEHRETIYGPLSDLFDLDSMLYVIADERVGFASQQAEGADASAA